MPVLYDNNEKIFNLQTGNTSYVIGVLKDKYLVHLYYGPKIHGYQNPEENLPVREAGAFTGADIAGFNYVTDMLPMEYPCYGSADLRTPAFHAEYEDGSAVTCLEYAGYQIVKGKPQLKGLPATYVENDEEAETLEIILQDKLTGLKIELSYTVFVEYDAIAKSVRVKNAGNQRIKIKSLLSSTIHLTDKNYQFVHLEGSWARECDIQKKELINGIMSIDSKRCSSSHFHNPFLALARPWATETQGEVYGMSLVYSGNHIAQTDTNTYDIVRVQMGINSFGFQWLLEPGEELQAPEAILTYSDSGYGQMSRTFHKLYRTRLCRGKYRDIERPVLINNWEATYFDFTEEKILEIARKAKTVGIELMVLDDGWFGKRNSDKSSLGDWFPNTEKLPNGIRGLAEKVTDLGMMFGLWMEPEMVSEDSELYRAHPDWCIHVEGRNRTTGRNQLVLDLSRKEVCDYIVDTVSEILGTAPISYVKWDMNRNITEIGSAGLPAERQQELPHRYMLGLYDVLERIVTAFPDVLFEGCSGGGGRFDAGMLHYFPQYWTSDDTDAIERLYIQHGTSMVMPSSAMSAHVSAVPNHQVNRTTPLTTRGNVAMMGQFGYELDLNKLNDQEIEVVRKQIKTYRRIGSVVHRGEMYRLKSPFEGRNTAWEYVSEDKTTVVLMYCVIRARVQTGLSRIQFQGLESLAQYQDEETGKIYAGDYLMHVGLCVDDDSDYKSQLMILKKVGEGACGD